MPPPAGQSPSRKRLRHKVWPIFNRRLIRLWRTWHLIKTPFFARCRETLPLANPQNLPRTRPNAYKSYNFGFWNLILKILNQKFKILDLAID
ncbi:MAG: hypothetical protein COT91_01510 [Candidatus Doudnabacteria bacterium CG10_big_fil_rev_8_21_14_0_10_41_10]|uniref:Uncharacterized protein n=1 Tax=Candidatus Doudnabacteria bacterium CG10_big_fil_rev_8_21_14_0_10_41_10 TaxID=1974551 RepID=A0A2H0VE89_9BACT|nr:MAG: hypothetical protein COT91_01510 [Candidatus Doudnabacteria bacterium CG10_big_fil_rev_8_21_14_0_10_41_10]